jgi:hypothetical protein
LILNPDPTVILHAVAAAGTGVAFALAVAMFGPRLRGAVDIDRFRFGSSVALGMLAIDVLGVLPTDRPIALGVLGVTALFAYDPAAAESVEEYDHGLESDDDPVESSEVPVPSAVADGGNRDESASDAESEVSNDAEDGGDAGYGYPAESDSRAPWL